MKRNLLCALLAGCLSVMPVVGHSHADRIGYEEAYTTEIIQLSKIDRMQSSLVPRMFNEEISIIVNWIFPF